jgi:Dolichyl-phosphate-mannose-protein mannosyltransferase
MRLLAAIFANALLLVAAFGLGSLLGPLFPKKLERLDRLAAMMASGLGLLGTLLFLVGLAAFSRVVILSILISAALLGAWRIYHEAREGGVKLGAIRVPALPAAIIALLLVVTFLGGLAEPVGDIKLDAIAYHFLGPRVWLRDAVIHVVADECHASFPATVETLYAALTSIGGTRAPELFAVISLGVLLLVSYGFAMRLGLDSRGAWWAIALVATMPVAYRGAYGGFVDAIFSSFILLALRFALDRESTGEYVLAGMFGGLAAGTKYTGLPAVVLIAMAAVLLTAARQGTLVAKNVTRVAALGATACVVASPWYLRNWVVLGSPIYPPPPGLLRFFHIKYMSPQAIDALAVIIRKEGLGMGHGLGSLVLLPFNFTFHPANFLNGAGGVGVCLLALAPFGILLRGRDPFVGALGFFSFMEVLGWFVTEQEARFLIHIYVVVAIFAIWGWREVAAMSPRWGRGLAAAAIVISIVYGLILIVPERVPDIRAAVSADFEAKRKAEEIPFVQSFAYLNDEEQVKKVLVLEPRVPTFYLKKDYLKPVGRFQEQTVPEGNDFERLENKLKAYGITHVLDVRLEGHDFRVPESAGNLELVLERGDQRVYRVVE